MTGAATNDPASPLIRNGVSAEASGDRQALVLHAIEDPIHRSDQVVDIRFRVGGAEHATGVE
jgi:hypothetical protein